MPDSDSHDPASQSTTGADVASCVIRVASLEQSARFYCQVFDCKVVIRERDMLLLSTPKGFQIYLHQAANLRPRREDELGIQFMVWATDSESEQRRIAERMRAQDVAVYCHSVAGMTILEGVDPDGSRVVVACPGPGQMPCTHIAPRLRA